MSAEGQRSVDSLLATYHKDLMGPTPLFSRSIFRNLARELEDGEKPVALVGAKQSMRVFALLLTDHRLIVMHPSEYEGVMDAPLGEVSAYLWRGGFGGQKLTLEDSEGSLTLSKPLPAPEAHRLCAILAPSEINEIDRGEALLKADLEDPGAVPLSVFEGLAAYHDRIVDEEGNHLPYRGKVDVTVDELGSISAVRGRNLANKGVGTLMFGPIGLFMVGNAKTTNVDNRELYLMIESDDWVFSRKCDPKKAELAYEFAAKVKDASKSIAETRSPTDRSHVTNNGIAQEIREFARLRDEGILTEGEFMQRKAKLLDR